MNARNKTLLACALAAATLCGTTARADTPDAELKLSATTLKTNQALNVTFSSSVFCSIQMVALGLDDQSQSQYKQPEYLKTFTPPEQYQFSFPKAGKYRVWAKLLDGTTCGNMKSVMMSTDIVVTPPVTPPSGMVVSAAAASLNPGIIQVNPPAANPPRIVSVSATPTDTTVGTDVVMDAHLDGDIELCKAVVSWGDNSGIPSTDIHHYNLPTMSYIHKYLAPGSYVASVMPISGCTGGGRVVVNVTAKPGTGGTPGTSGMDPTGKPTTPGTNGGGGVPGTDPNGKPSTPTTPPLGKLTGLTLSGGTLTNAPNMFKTTDTLYATAQGITGGKCGILISSTATFAQPTGVGVDASNPFAIQQKFTGLKPGMQSATAMGSAGPGYPACQGGPFTVNFTVK